MRPPPAFITWWEPAGSDDATGASVGGHPDARRIWARIDNGQITRRVTGTDAIHAWAHDGYRDEFYQWVAAGKPQGEPFVSLAATLEQQAMFTSVVANTVRAIKRTIKPMQTDYDKGKAPFVEPVDEQKARTKEETSDEPIEFGG
jgi:hypothetical protein